MNKHLAIVFALLSLSASASVEIKNSKITDVTIYRNYAKESRIAVANLPAGNSEVVISNITTSIDENSIQVGCKNQVRILSVSSRMNYLTNESENKQKQIVVWTDSIKVLDKNVRFIIRKKEAYENELNILQQNTKLGAQQEGLKPAQLKELLELNRIKQLEIKKLLFDADEESTDIKHTITRLQAQINENNGTMQQSQVREIVLKVNSPSDVSTQFKISYLTTTASWSPTYEIRCENTGKPLLLTSRAKIVQQTGYDWKNVHIKLSTANPLLNHNRPVLYPIYVDFMQPDYYSAVLSSTKENTYANMAQMKAPAPASVQMMSYNEAEKKDDFQNGMKIDPSQVTIAESNLMLEYDLADVHDIESDGQEHIVGIQEISIPATFNYHTVPKLDFGVFLIARISDWGKYNLLAGETTIFFDDMYVGKSYLNPNTASDTLLISLGRDERVQVKRIKLNELCTSKRFSSKKKETFAYEIQLKNTKSIPLELEVLDQFPLSSNSDIEVELLEASNAEVTKEYGKLLWRVKLLPNESKRLKMMYSVKFPEDKAIKERN
ncbi:MAG TPA: DUF4139 domain-containing protein [Chitinophagaceae bacterium]|nr:DUF4139 domain-containing protein [Chitinophagaceae bacterium]